MGVNITGYTQHRKALRYAGRHDVVTVAKPDLLGAFKFISNLWPRLECAGPNVLKIIKA